MAELTFKSPGVSTREIDLSGPTNAAPTGTPAAVIGTAKQGRAFVPITVGTFADFVTEFGTSDGETFGPMAVQAWLRNAGSATYVRLLGAGDGKKRDSNGAVTRGGFIVGTEQVATTGKQSGMVVSNEYAGAGRRAEAPKGRTHFLGVIMKEVNSSGLFTNAGMGAVHPVLRGVLMAPSGVNPALSASRGSTATSRALGGFSGNNTPIAGPAGPDQAAVGTFGVYNAAVGASARDAGSTVGAINIAGGKQEFVLLLNGHKHTAQYPNIITASMDPTAPNYFARVLNTDSTKVENAGHYLQSHYNIYPNLAVPTGSTLVSTAYSNGNSCVTPAGTVAQNGANPCSSGRKLGAPTDPFGNALNLEDIVLLVTSSQARNVGTTAIPNFEGFSDRYRTALSPYVISQTYGGQHKNLFRVHALDDGAIGNTRVKISIENIVKSNNDLNPFGTFDLLVRDFNDTDSLPVVIEKYPKLSLNPSDERYVSRVIGDMHLYYDFDKRPGAQKLIVDGSYANRSNYIRIEASDDLANGRVDASALPLGFRGLQHIISSGSNIFKANEPAASGSLSAGTIASRLVQPPVPFRRTVAKGQAPKKRVDSSLYWGMQMEVRDSVVEPNKNVQHDDSVPSFTKYFPNYHLTQQKAMEGANEGKADSSGTVYDADRFNNNIFSLDRIQVITKDDKADANQWAAATYRRNGTKTATMTDIDGSSSALTRLLDVSKDFSLSSARRFLKYTFVVQGGFDGSNIFSEDKSKFKNAAVKREQDDETKQGGTQGPTTAAYRKALDILEERSDVSIQLLAIPGIRHKAVSDYAIQTVEDRFDALYIMDMEARDTLNTVITGSSNEQVSVTNTVTAFRSRNLDSSFAAAYFPDVMMRDAGTGRTMVVPPSVPVLGAFSLNDRLAHPWFAPAGFSRGALKNVTETAVKLSRNNLDALYEVDVNPITSFPQSQDVVVFGQKTLLAAQSALDRVNVRRLLIDIRRQVRSVGDSFLFEPNRESTLARFAGQVSPILARIQAQQGLERFKVQIDTTTTTQADVENNTIRGKIFLQPVRSVEFISLDFVITNAGTDI